MGVVSAIIKFSGLHLTIPFSKETATNPATGELVELITYWHQTTDGQWMSLVAYGALIGFFVWFVLKDKKQA